MRQGGDFIAIDFDAAPGRMQLAGNQTQYGCFPDTAGTHDSHDAATLNIHADVIKYDFVITFKRHVSNADNRIFQAVVPIAGLCCFDCMMF